MKKNSIGLIGIVVFLFVIIQPSAAVITPYYNDLAGFNSAAGTPPVIVDFDALPVNQPAPPVNGVSFQLLPNAAIPFVIKASESYSPAGFSWSGPENKLYATSGENVLSPGGIELAPGLNEPLENDDMMVTFIPPVQAVGFDLLFQSLDGSSYVGIQVLDSEDNTIFSSGSVPITAAPGSTGGSNFIGLVSDSENIASIIILDNDDNNVNPDCNIGLDTIRSTGDEQPISCGDGICNGQETCSSCEADCGPCPAVPEFPSFALPATMILGFLGAVLFIQRSREH